MIALNSVSMVYSVTDRPLQILNDVSVRFEAGESVAIVGPSGSGKTTMLLLLAGLEDPVEGHISFGDLRFSELSRDQLADLRRDRLGIIFQSFHLVPSLTALGNVTLPLDLAGVPESRILAENMLHEVGLGARVHHYPDQLSGGEQQRVAIARALVHRPLLVLADEPTGNLDLHTGERIIDLLFRLQKESGSTLVLVTHDEELASRCDRRLHLCEGKLVEPPEHALPA